MSILLFPAIDLLSGEAVRLYQGDFAQKTVYHKDPLQVAQGIAQDGATHLHLVDLDGARTGEAVNRQVIARIASQTDLFVQVGGGIRDLQRAQMYLDAGVRRVILGTAAVEDTAFLAEAVRHFGERVAVGVDVRDGLVATRGWRTTTQLSLEDFLPTLQRLGVQTLIVTDISRDGAMRGPNAALYEQLQSGGGFQLIASGGVSTLDDLVALRALNLHGAIVGKALYTGAINLKNALEILT